MDARSVLIVDPDRDSLNIYSLVLEHHGFHVLIATDAREAREVIIRQRPQVIITELLLPQHGSETLLELLDSDPEMRDAAVIAITSVPRGYWREPEGDHRGYAGYLMKPCTPTRVLDEVRRVLSGRPPRRTPVPLQA